MQESLDPSRDIEIGTNACTMDSDANCIPSRPVLSIGCGEGFPYAPNDWPLPGDKWVWKTGNRKGRGGYWRDRCLHPPKRLKKGAGFRSKRSVREYIEQKFPDANVDAFFSSFHWRIPCIEQSQTKANPEHGRKRSSPGSSSKAESDLPHANDPEDDSGDSEMSTGQDSSSNISMPVQTPTPVNSVAGHATCRAEELLGGLPTSQEELLSMENEFPAVIFRFLTSALEKLTNELNSTRVESLGDRMGYFNDHVAWFAHLKSPVEQFKQNLNSIHWWYQEQMDRRREIEVELSKIDKEILEYNQKISELQQTAEKLRYENESLLSETNRPDRNSSRPGSSSQGNSQLGLAIIGEEFSGILLTSQQLVELPNFIRQALASAVEQLTNELQWMPLGYLRDKLGYFRNHIEWFARYKFPVENLNSIHASYQRQFGRLHEIGGELNQCQEKILEYEQGKLKELERIRKLNMEKETILGRVIGSSQI